MVSLDIIFPRRHDWRRRRAFILAPWFFSPNERAGEASRLMILEAWLRLDRPPAFRDHVFLFPWLFSCTVAAASVTFANFCHAFFDRW